MRNLLVGTCVLLSTALFLPRLAHAADVLVIWDDSATNANTLSLVSAIEASGHDVTLSDTSETEYDGTNPSPSGFDTVIHLNGTTYETSMPDAGQSALLAYVQGGGGYIGTEWNAFEIDSQGRTPTLVDLTLVTYAGGAEGPVTINVTDATHPVMSGLASSFSIGDTGYCFGGARTFSADAPSVVATDGEGNPAVVVREYDAGRVVTFHHSGNYLGYGPLSNANVQLLYANAVSWTTEFACDDADDDGFDDLACGGDDCDDTDSTVYPGAPEYCDGDDDDCDAVVDEDAVDASPWFADVDTDGYGDANTLSVACTAPEDFVADDSDCGDDDARVYPGAPEVCDGRDDDCDTALPADESDADGDGYVACTVDLGGWGGEAITGGDDCDDTDAAVFPGADEVLDDGVDQDCSGLDEVSAPEDTGDTAADDGADDGGQGCGCGTSTPVSSSGLALLAGLAGLVRRRRA